MATLTLSLAAVAFLLPLVPPPSGARPPPSRCRALLAATFSDDRPDSIGDASERGIRINKVFTSAYSRRAADQLVADGRVLLNGAVAVAGDRVLPGDEVALDGVPWTDGLGEPAGGQHVYVKYWKPTGVTCTTDERVRGNIIDALRRAGLRTESRIFTVGRLDKESEGLILLTSDGRLPNSVGRSAFAHTKLYAVTCDRPLADSHLRRLSRGVTITTSAQRDRGPPKVLTAPTLPCEVRRLDERSFEITLTEGRNRQASRPHRHPRRNPAPCEERTRAPGPLRAPRSPHPSTRIPPAPLATDPQDV